MKMARYLEWIKGCRRGRRVVCLKARRCQMKRPGPFSTCHRNSAAITPRSPREARALINDGGSGGGALSCLPAPHPRSPPPLPQVMFYECCLITRPRILHTGWHIYLFVLYLFASRLYAKSFCDRLVYSRALPRQDETNEQIEEGRRAIDGQSLGRCAAG